VVRKKFLVDFYFNDGGKYIVGSSNRNSENSNYTFKIEIEKNQIAKNTFLK